MGCRHTPAEGALRGHQGHVCSVAFSPGRRLVSAAFDGTVRIWDSSTGQEIHELRVQQAPVYGVAYSPDGLRIAAGVDDRMVKLWDAASGKEIGSSTGHGGAAGRVAFSPDGAGLSPPPEEMSA